MVKKSSSQPPSSPSSSSPPKPKMGPKDSPSKSGENKSYCVPKFSDLPAYKAFGRMSSDTLNETPSHQQPPPRYSPSPINLHAPPPIPEAALDHGPSSLRNPRPGSPWHRDSVQPPWRSPYSPLIPSLPRQRCNDSFPAQPSSPHQYGSSIRGNSSTPARMPGYHGSGSPSPTRQGPYPPQPTYSETSSPGRSTPTGSSTEEKKPRRPRMMPGLMIRDITGNPYDISQSTYSQTPSPGRSTPTGSSTEEQHRSPRRMAGLAIRGSNGHIYDISQPTYSETPSPGWATPTASSTGEYQPPRMRAEAAIRASTAHWSQGLLSPRTDNKRKHAGTTIRDEQGNLVPANQPTSRPASGKSEDRARFGASSSPEFELEQERGLMGAVAGGAAGGYAGHQVKHGFLGLLAGAFAGHKLEEAYKNGKSQQQQQQQTPPPPQPPAAPSSSTPYSSDDETVDGSHFPPSPHRPSPSPSNPDKRLGNFSLSCTRITLDADYDLIAECRTAGGKTRLSSISLNACLTNNDGRLAWARNGGFGGSARNVSLKAEGRFLEAELRTRSGDWRWDLICLDEMIANLNGDLRMV